MARELYTNFAESTLASAITSGATSLSVASGDGAKFPSPGSGQIFWAVLEEGTTREVVKVTARSTDTFTVVRGQQGTTASAFGAGAKVRLAVLKTIEDVARHVVLASAKGPAASSPATETSIQTYTLPGGTMEPGDVLRIVAHWRKTGGNVGMRLALEFGATTVVDRSTAGATDIGERMECMIAAYNATAQRAFGYRMRSNLALTAGLTTSPAVDLANDITIDFRGNFNTTTTDTLELVHYLIELLRA